MHNERELATGRGPAYEKILHPDAVVIVPGAVLNKPACVAAMNASPGWDHVELDEVQLVTHEDVATVVYTFVGLRNSLRYQAILSSTYVRTPFGWRLILHQQTPRGSS